MIGAQTPGPWTVKRIDYSKRLDVSFEIKAGRDLVAQTIMREIATEPERIATDEANARLIAAVPALLDTCKQLRDALAAAMRVVAAASLVPAFVHEMKISGLTPGFGKRADDCIAKAEGRTA